MFGTLGIGPYSSFFYLSLPAALRAAQACRYLIYSEADFEFFRPAGATLCTDGSEVWHGVGDHPSVLNFTPIGATCRPCGAKKLKIGL